MIVEFTTIPLQFESPLAAELFFLGRLLFSGVLAFMGLNHFLNIDSMTGYAEFKGLPAPRAAVIGSGLVLILGGLGVVAGIYPVVTAGALAVFLIISAITMHNFWTVEDPEEKQSELTSFLKNVYGAGAALVLLAVGGSAWPYAVDIGLF